MKFYAKTYFNNGIKEGESLEEHTEALLAAYKDLKDLYSREISERTKTGTFWEDLWIASLLHDLGKISTPFQNKIRKALKLSPLSSGNYKEITHNYISPAFLSGFPELGKKEQREHLYRLIFAIAFHHQRELNFKEEDLKKCLNEDVKSLFEHIKDWVQGHCPNLKVDHPPKAFYYSKLQEFIDGNNEIVNNIKHDNDFILLKGLLHRLDFAASAYLPVETSRLGDTTKPLLNYLSQKHGAEALKPFQKRAIDYRGQNIIATASTGIGKTEFAINWLGDQKGFYTLPLRVSSNAMHQRLIEIFEPEKIGLLHSDSVSYQIENMEEFSIEENVHKIDISEQFSLPLTVTTADQLFTSVFKWSGYERIYATLAYSKIILDEPQGYSPKTLAMIIKCLEEISALGARFCYMSATNHPFIINRLQNTANVLKPEFNTEPKHKLEVKDSSIEQLEDQILSTYQNGKKVLVICNTVKKSQELYKKLATEGNNVKLLHSGFIKSDRASKEDEIQEDFKSGKAVIWISTQIVEASLDIDYDVLFTEVATLDSLIQRMGRIYRKKGRVIKEESSPNIVIATNEPSDKYFIYEKTITQRTISALKEYYHKIIYDQDKQDLMDKVYKEDEIKGTKFYKDFDSAYKLLEYGFQADNKNEAQKLFREISQVNGIPREIYGQNDEKIDDLIMQLKSKKSGRNSRILANYELSQFTLSVPPWKSSNSELMKSRDKSNAIFLIPGSYDYYKGLQNNEIENIF